MKLIESSRWKEAVRTGTASDFDGLRKFFFPQIKQVEENPLALEFIISSGAVDRDNDTIDPLGWDLSNYAKNPVVLWAHDYWSPPVARAPETFVDNVAKKLKSKAVFTPQEIYPFGFTILQLYKNGYLNATSVGFKPNEWRNSDDRKWGIDFVRQELLEYSCVPVPSNPEALIEARGKGIDVSPLRDWAEKMLDEWHQEEGIWLPRSKVERVFSLLDSKKHFTMPAIMKGVIPYKETPLADEGEEWDGPAEVAAAEVEDLKVMCTWFDDSNPDVKSAYKLPHHKAGGEHLCVWRGVAAAMAALMGGRGGVNIPDSDRKGVYNHLARHYKDFDKEPPEFSQEAPEAKTGRVLSARNEEKLRQANDLIDRANFLVDEVLSQLEPAEEESFTPTNVTSTESTSKKNIPLSTLKEIITAVVKEELETSLKKAMGRLD